VGNWVCSIPKKTCSFGLSASSTFLLEQISHQNKSAPAISHQPNEQAQSRVITYLSCDWSYDAMHHPLSDDIMDSYQKKKIQFRKQLLVIPTHGFAPPVGIHHAGPWHPAQA
jgi:hypothetical protein